MIDKQGIMRCPKCNGTEWLPEEERQEGDKMTVNPYKVMIDESRGWESKCLSCDIFFVDDELWDEEIGLYIKSDSGHKAIWIDGAYRIID